MNLDKKEEKLFLIKPFHINLDFFKFVLWCKMFSLSLQPNISYAEHC